MLVGAWALGALVLLPLLARPTIAIALAFAAVAGWLAWKSVAYPLALAEVPTIVAATVGSNPLPKGSTTFGVAAWIGLAIVFTIMRGERTLSGRLLMSAPVALSLVLLGLMILRLSPSPDEAYGSMKVQLFIADNLMIFLGALFVGSRRQDFGRFLMLLLAVTSAGALILLFELVTGGASATVGERLSLGAKEYPIYLARNSADGLMIAIYTILAARRTAVRLFAIAVFPVLLVAMIGAGSRGPVLAFLLGLVALVALTAAGGRARRRLLQVAVALLAAAVVVPVVVPGSAVGRALSAVVGGASGLSTNGRAHLWSLAYTTFGQHPALGIGTGGFAALNTESYPHNILLEAAAELGAVGLLVLLAFLVTVLTRLVALWRSAPDAQKLDVAVLISLFLAALTNAFFSGAISDNFEIWLWAGLGFGMSARLAGRAQWTHRRTPRPRVQWNGRPDWSPFGISARVRGLKAE